MKKLKTHLKTRVERKVIYWSKPERRAAVDRKLLSTLSLTT